MKKTRINTNLITFKVTTTFDYNEYNEVELSPVNVSIILQTDNDEEKEIGTLSGYLMSDTEATDCYDAMDNHSLEMVDLANEFIEPREDDFEDEDEEGENYLKEWVIDISEYTHTNVLIVKRVLIDEQYRGNGILKVLVNVLLKSFKCPIILKAFPLQFEGNADQKREFNKASLKVRKAYMKCGFEPIKRGSEYMSITSHGFIQEKSFV